MNKMGEARKAEVSETEALLQTAIKELIRCARELDQYGSLESAARADKVIASIRAAELSAHETCEECEYTMRVYLLPCRKHRKQQWGFPPP